MNKVAQIYVGVDVSKAHLDVHLFPLDKSFRVTNSPEGMEKFLEKLKPHSIGLVVCEATGGYEFLMLKTLGEFGYPTWQVEPNRIKSFIRSEGKRAKNDKIDAKMIALFASQKKNPHPPVECRYTEQFQELHDLVARREDLSNIRKGECQRLGAPMPNLCTNSLEEHIAFLDKQMAEIEESIDALVKKNAEFNHKVSIMESIPGVGRITAVTLLVYTPELGLLDDKKAAALVGVAPYVHQSGQFTGTAKIGGGRAEPRAVLFMAAMAAVVHNPVLRAFYQKLKNAGKKSKVALVAVIRKIIVILNAMLRKNEMWCPMIQK